MSSADKIKGNFSKPKSKKVRQKEFKTQKKKFIPVGINVELNQNGGIEDIFMAYGESKTSFKRRFYALPLSNHSDFKKCIQDPLRSLKLCKKAFLNFLAYKLEKRLSGKTSRSIGKKVWKKIRRAGSNFNNQLRSYVNYLALLINPKLNYKY